MNSYSQSFHGHFILNDSSSDDSVSSCDVNDDEQFNLQFPDDMEDYQFSSDDSATSELSEENSDILTNQEDFDLYMFPAFTKNSATHILLSAVLYAFVIKGFTADGLNCVLSMLLAFYSIEDFPKSVLSLLRKFKKDIFNFSDKVVLKHFCKRCNLELGQFERCRHCNNNISSMANIDVFMQLQLILSNHFYAIKNYQNYTRNCDNGDILCGLDFLTVHDYNIHLHLQINTDGGSPYKTSGYSYWPLSALVLDLPPNLRYNPENILLLSLWRGSSKPMWDFYLNSFLSSVPFDTPTNVKIGNISLTVTLSLSRAVFDLPALASILNVKQFNGKFGCIFCNHPGVSVERAWTYPYCELVQSTSDESFSKYSIAADKSKECVFGVKGFSVLKDYLKIPSDISLDPLHLYFENITKMLINYMISTRNRHKINYIGRKLNYMNAFMLNIRVPHNMNKFRNFEYLNFWTGREFQNFLYYVLLPLIGFNLPYPHFIHLACFVLGVRLSTSAKARMNKDNIDILFRHFVQTMEELFSSQELTINVHLLLHVPQKIQHSGSLNFSSMAPYEAQFKIMKNVIKGTTGHLNQVVSKFLLLKATHTFLLSHSESQSTYYHHIAKLLHIQISPSKLSDIEVIDANRFRIHHNVFHTSKYPKAKSSESFYCKTKDYLGKIVDCFLISDVLHLEIQIFKLVDVNLFHGNDAISILLNHLFPRFYNFVELTNKTIVIQANTVLAKCLLLNDVTYGTVSYCLLCVLPDLFIFS